MFGDMIYASYVILQAPEFNLNRSSWYYHNNFFFYKGSEAKIIRVQSHNPEEHFLKISGIGSQYFQRYDLPKLGLFEASEFHLKEVIVGKYS